MLWALSILSFPRQSPLSTYRSLGSFRLLLTTIFVRISEVWATIHARYAALDCFAFDLTQDFAEAEGIGIPNRLIDNLCEVGKGGTRTPTPFSTWS
jgi:hypothetical protein